MSGSANCPVPSGRSLPLLPLAATNPKVLSSPWLRPGIRQAGGRSCSSEGNLGKGGDAVLAGSRTGVNCLEGSYTHHYTTNHRDGTHTTEGTATSQRPEPSTSLRSPPMLSSLGCCNQARRARSTGPQGPGTPGTASDRSPPSHFTSLDASSGNKRGGTWGVNFAGTRVPAGCQVRSPRARAWPRQEHPGCAPRLGAESGSQVWPRRSSPSGPLSG